MTSATYFVLAALLDNRLHGYGIIGKAAEISDGDIRLTAGTLYGVLDRLASKGLILQDGDEVVDGRLRRYYRITDEGAEAVRREATLLTRAARAVESGIALRSRPA